MKNIILWIITGFCAFCAFGCIASGTFIGFILCAIAIFLVLPIPFVTKVLNKIKINRWLAVVVAIVLVFAGILTSPQPPEEKKSNDNNKALEQTDEQSNISTDLNAENSSTEQNTDDGDATDTVIPPQQSTVDDTHTEVTPDDKPQIEVTPPTAETKPSTPATPSVPSQPSPAPDTPVQSTPTADNNSDIVYRTPSGERYHVDPECAGPKRKQISRTDAINERLTPCGTCVLK